MNEKSEEKRKKQKKCDEKKLRKMSSVSLWLDGYDDLFSDFDLRPTSQRALSDDFLYEAKKASKDKVSGKIELNLLLEAKKRNRYVENIIKKRLRQHFNKHHALLHKEANEIIKKGVSFVSLGVILMFIASFILFKYPERTFFSSFLIVLLEPGGWFLFWEGMDLIFFESKRKESDLKFYEKMSKCEINFLSC